jgi:hypothetical protein
MGATDIEELHRSQHYQFLLEVRDMCMCVC